MIDPEFEAERKANVEALRTDTDLQRVGREFTRASVQRGYSYNFDWLGLPIIQYPTDVVAVQELIWRIRPAAIVETGVARGGSLILSASILELLGGDGIVIGVEVDLRDHNRQAIEAHPLAHRVRLVDGSSIDMATVARVMQLVGQRQPVLVLLDSMHTHGHVLAELSSYSPLVRQGSYVVVFDTLIEDMPEGTYSGRPWSSIDNPRTAVRAFLADNPRFQVDDDITARLQITVASGGYLRCIADPGRSRRAERSTS